MAKNYDKSSAESIFHYAKQLTGKSLSDVIDLPDDVANIRNRGDLGSLLEKFYFEQIPPNNHEPDFPEAGVELKTTGVVKKSKGVFRAKERLVLMMINYTNIVNEKWETSTFLHKCRLMLIMFYQYEKETPVIRRKFILDPLLFTIPENDLQIIRRDWELIQRKVAQGKAHELSEGDTFYLGACRKGSGGLREKLIYYPSSPVKAKSRAFALKQSYLNQLITNHISESSTLQIDDEISIEDATYLRFKPYISQSINEISNHFNYHKKGKNHKAFKYELCMRILSNGKRKVPELERAEIELKTISLNKSGVPKEHMSFPGFKFLDIINESWEDSTFYAKLERKFLFVVFQESETGLERLIKVGYWNMPYEDRMEAKRVWERTKKLVITNPTSLPSANESRVAHVRPKGKDGKDQIPTPQGSLHLRQCFWLNKSYISGVIADLN